MSHSLIPEIVFHVGLGKCGSSSIQSFLSRSDEALLANNVRYLGLNLERSESIKYQWQNDRGVNDLLGVVNWEDEYASALEEEIKYCSTRGVNKLIISNESLFSNYSPLSRVLARIQGTSDTHVIIVFRRVHELSCSSYMQWIVKDKTRLGPLLSFSDWLELEKDGLPWIHEELDLWLSTEYAKKNSLISLETSHNIIEDFCYAAGISFLLPKLNEGAQVRENISDDVFTFLLRAIFQSGQNGMSPPWRFDKIYQLLSFSAINSSQPVPASILLPSPIQVERFIEKCDERVDLFNQVVRKHGYSHLQMIKSGEKKFIMPAPLNQLSSFDEACIYVRAIAAMFSCIERQQKSIEELEEEISSLKYRLDAMK